MVPPAVAVSSSGSVKPNYLAGYLANEGFKYPTTVVKRDGRTVQFDPARIMRAIENCFNELDPKPIFNTPEDLANRVINLLMVKGGETPTVEQIQDAVELVLQSAGEYAAAKAYIIYRVEHAKKRGREVPAEIRALYQDSDKYFPTPVQKFQFFDKYSRFDWETGARETWVQTVDRSVAFLKELERTNAGSQKLADYEWAWLRQMILEMKALPSMRLLAMAGEAARRQNASIYNCTVIAVNSVDAWTEAMLLSMAGCGVGFSVESKHVEQLPRVQRQKARSPLQYKVEDSSEGWVDSLRTGLNLWLAGDDVQFNYDDIRPAGAPLKVKGGRASGPQPLKYVHDFARSKILSRQGSIIRPIDAHDIMCAVGQAVVSGGVRRTAMISLFDFNDLEMRLSKDAGFEHENSQRWNANNSAVWPIDRDLTQQEVMQQMMAMFQTERGEPGIFSRAAVLKNMPERRRALGYEDFLTNPCGEIVLRDQEMCNLTIAVARANDTVSDLEEKVRAATILGTIQSMATHFPGLRPGWKKNAEEERLLGVDITGQMDCPAVQDGQVMRRLRDEVVRTNQYYAQQFGINQAAATTTVKPSGNSSQLLDCSSGLHARMFPYYERNIRVSATSALFKIMRDAGVPMDPENHQQPETATTWVIHFPMKAPDGAVTGTSRSAIEQCEYWLLNKLNWTEHNPSVTITYRPDEMLAVTQWVWEHRDVVGGMAFLPLFEAQYEQLPYIPITKEDYEARVAAFPDVDFSELYRYEATDLTSAAQELACLAGVCDTDQAIEETAA